MSEEGRERLRQAALANKPWLRATGPRTPEGKERSAANSQRQKKGAKSVRERRAAIADINALLMTLRECRIAAVEKQPGDITRSGFG
ncbi:hypothetical protein [Novipirellula aureliae]|uniref:hypothetical protein n=1 Tax=Novipirellula aureliae TaxID=2527966 RepID=UPI0011B40F14|nr:hypothetical protein [Novipirellula aureliae]